MGDKAIRERRGRAGQDALPAYVRTMGAESEVMGIIGHQRDPLTAMLEQLLRSQNFLVTRINPKQIFSGGGHPAHRGVELEILLCGAGSHTTDSLILAPSGTHDTDTVMRALGLALQELEERSIVVHRDSDAPFVKVSQIEDAIVFTL